MRCDSSWRHITFSTSEHGSSTCPVSLSVMSLAANGWLKQLQVVNKGRMPWISIALSCKHCLHLLSLGLLVQVAEDRRRFLLSYVQKVDAEIMEQFAEHAPVQVGITPACLHVSDKPQLPACLSAAQWGR